VKRYADVSAALQLTQSHLKAIAEAAAARKDEAAMLETHILMSINAQAYFAMLFFQLEDHINARCADLIAERRALADWDQRRAWDVLDGRTVESIPFLQRLALVAERGKADYNAVLEMYRHRNSIAHGQLLERTLDVDSLAEMIAQIAKRL